MRVIVGESQRGAYLASAIVLASLTLLALTIFTSSADRIAAPVLAVVVLLAIAQKTLLSWRSLLTLTIVVILFIPIRRYSIPGGLPFQLEPYRVVVALIAIVWLTSLLIDPRVRMRTTGLEAPIIGFLLAILLSIVANRPRIAETNSFVVKGTMFFVSFVLVFFLVASLARRVPDIQFFSMVLAGGGAILGVAALVEFRTNYNVFDHMHSLLPFLKFDSARAAGLARLHRGGRLRVYASAQHPIAFSAALAMILPLAVYLAQTTRRRIWWLAAALILMGCLTTKSRTGVTMLAVVALVYLLLRPTQVKRFWPALLPAVVAIHFVLPGTIGTIRGSFFPKGGLVAQQTNQRVGSGRLATLGPALDREFKPHPFFGEGYSTRITHREPDFPQPNAPITDDGWLSVLLETGIVGALFFFWMFARAIRRMGKAAKGDLSPRGSYLVAATASVASFGVGMFTYDALTFIQVTFFLFIVLALGMSALRTSPDEWQRPAPPRRP